MQIFLTFNEFQSFFFMISTTIGGADMPKEVGVGEKMPPFTLKDQDGKPFSSSQLLGKKNLLLSFHPLAFTPVCAAQMKELEKNFAFFTKNMTVPVGISIDHDPVKKAWAKSLKIRKLRMLCDFWPHGELALKLGLFFRQFGFSRRAVLLVDAKGIVRFVKVYPIHQLPDIAEIKEQVSMLAGMK
jgi:peroxiredoxin